MVKARLLLTGCLALQLLGVAEAGEIPNSTRVRSGPSYQTRYQRVLKQYDRLVTSQIPKGQRKRNKAAAGPPDEGRRPSDVHVVLKKMAALGTARLHLRRGELEASLPDGSRYAIRPTDGPMRAWVDSNGGTGKPLNEVLLGDLRHGGPVAEARARILPLAKNLATTALLSALVEQRSPRVDSKSGSLGYYQHAPQERVGHLSGKKLSFRQLVNKALAEPSVKETLTHMARRAMRVSYDPKSMSLAGVNDLGEVFTVSLAANKDRHDMAAPLTGATIRLDPHIVEMIKKP